MKKAFCYFFGYIRILSTQAQQEEFPRSKNMLCFFKRYIWITDVRSNWTWYSSIKNEYEGGFWKVNTYEQILVIF